MVSADDVMYFQKDGTEWYYGPGAVTGVSRWGNYPDVRIRNIHGADFTLDNSKTLTGMLLFSSAQPQLKIFR
jgi:hypothetical protein